MSSSSELQRHPWPATIRPPRPETSDVVLYWRAIALHKWLILAASLALGTLTGVVVFMMTPVYRATTTVIIEQNKPKVVAIDEVYSGIGANPEHFKTQAEIIRSPALAGRVIEQLGLTSNPEFDPRQQKPPFWKAAFFRAGDASNEQDWPEKRVRGLVLLEFMSRTMVDPLSASQLIRISFDSRDPELAAQIANAIAEAYIENDVSLRQSMNKGAAAWLKDRLADLKKTLDDSERQLQQYRDKANIVDAKGVAQGGLGRQIEDLTRPLADARQRRADAENTHVQLKSAKDVEALPVVLRNPAVARLKEHERDLQKRIAELSSRYGPEHPIMLQAESELRQARQNTRAQVDAVVSSLLSEYELARANERALERTIVEAQGRVQALNRKEFQLASLEHAVATNRQIHDVFLGRLKETSTGAPAQANTVARVVNVAQAPLAPYKPRRLPITLGAMVFGLLLAASAILLRDHFDSGIKSADDVEEKLGAPMLAMLPLLKNPAQSLGRHYLNEPNSVLSESIRTARSAVLLSAIDSPKKRLMITSSVPGEGKSAVAINLALSYAETASVLLVDADLRRPSIATQLGFRSSRPGLTSLVSGAATLSECVQKIADSRLSVIASGPIPVNALEIILSQRFHDTLTALSNEFDVVILDSPPVHTVSDALVMARMVNVVLFVVKADSTPYQLARRSVQALEDVDARPFGVILNQLDFRKADRYYGAYTSHYGTYESKSV